MRRNVVGGCALGLASGWNVANTGAVADELGRSYHVSLPVVGLFTTALFVTHLAMQIPGGRASDRFGARRTGLIGLAVIVGANALALASHSLALVIVARALGGIGTGLGFIAGSAYIRRTSGSPFAQGLYGGVGLAAGGLALGIVPQLVGPLGWRAPFESALVVAAVAGLVLALAPADRPVGELASGRAARVLRDRRLWPLAAVYAASLGLSVVLGNWVVTLLHRHGGLGKGYAGAIGALTLVLGVVTRPLGGWLMRKKPEWTRPALVWSLLAGAAGTGLLLLAHPPVVAGIGAALVGLAAGIPFAPAFEGAAAVRPDAPAAAVGMVNGAASVVVVAGTPLLGVTFSTWGGGRLGFAVVAVLWLAAALVVPRGSSVTGTVPASVPRGD